MQEMLAKLINLTIAQNYNEINKQLNELSVPEKGPAFERYIEELYRGNGWIAKRVEGTEYYGTDIIISHPKTPMEVSFIIKTKNRKNFLSFDDTRAELVQFEDIASKKHNCKNYILISLNGFAQQANELSSFNMKLEEFEYIKNLIFNYQIDGFRVPDIELFAHNKEAYLRIKEMWENNKRVAAVQATGTGKSYLILKCLFDLRDKNKLVLAPSQHILKSIEEKESLTSNKTRYMTYAEAMNLTTGEINKINLSLIVLDEFHRSGAEKWGEGVGRILDSYPNALVLGTSATPIRYLDSQRNISDELFNKKEAINLPLSDAIIKNILPEPKYVSAIYSLNEELDNLKFKIEESNDTTTDKTIYLDKLKNFQNDWELSGGITYILKKHITVSDNKFIVFCKNKEHLIYMESQVEMWFEQAYKQLGAQKRVRKYRVVHDEKENQKELDDFKSANSKGELHLLFAIEMLNEGLHVKDIDGVILLRPTVSPIIFYQQIGRALSAGKLKKPLIFDFVNNFISIKAGDFQKDLEDANDRENTRRKKLGLSENKLQLDIVDETHEFYGLIKEIEHSLKDMWQFRYSELVQYKIENKDCNVPNRYDKNPPLGQWVNSQRISKNKKTLSEDRIEKLDDLGFDWNPLDTQWENMYQQLAQYKLENNDCNVPKNYAENPALGIWVSRQRMLPNNNLTEHKIKKLNDIGFTWNLIDSYWESMFEELVIYKKENNDCNVPKRYHRNQQALGSWVVTQRQTKNKNKLAEHKIKKLDEIGFDWNPHDTKWDCIYKELIQYKLENKDCNVPSVYDKNLALGVWVNTQRKAKNKNIISEDKINKLNDLGFDWNPLDTQWENMYQELVQFKLENNHCNVPAVYDMNPPLGVWIGTQRKAKNKNTLLENKINKLNDLGFDWNPQDTQWDNMYEELVRHKLEHNNCNIPRDYIENPTLGKWVNTQRISKNKNKLSEDKLQKLNDLGFDWNPFDTQWDNMFEELVIYKLENNHCNVPAVYDKNTRLGLWVSTQRQSKRNNQRLSEDQIKKLEDIGFVWNPIESQWDAMYEELVQYKSEFNDCNVPKAYDENLPLGKWVGTQRISKNKNKLSEDKLQKLNDLGFCWNPLDAQWDAMYEELVQYKLVNNHCNVPYAYDKNPSLGRWIGTQRLSKNKNKLSEKKINKLNDIGFVWNIK